MPRLLQTYELRRGQLSPHVGDRSTDAKTKGHISFNYLRTLSSAEEASEELAKFMEEATNGGQWELEYGVVVVPSSAASDRLQELRNMRPPPQQRALVAQHFGINGFISQARNTVYDASARASHVYDSPTGIRHCLYAVKRVADCGTDESEVYDFCIYRRAEVPGTRSVVLFYNRDGINWQLASRALTGNRQGAVVPLPEPTVPGAPRPGNDHEAGPSGVPRG